MLSRSAVIRLGVALAAVVAACSEPSPPRVTPDATVAQDLAPPDTAPTSDDAVWDAPDATAVDAAMDAAMDAAVDADDAEDVEPPTDVGPLVGYIRFLNLAPGTGRVRFIAVNQPLFDPARIEVEVDEGSASEYVETLPISFYVDVYPAGHTTTDAGPPLAARIQSDVYFAAGCTVVFAGSPRGDPEELEERRLWRISDLPMRVAEPVSLMRVLSAVAPGPRLDVDEGDAGLVRAVRYFEPSGFRRVAPGLHRFEVRGSGDRALLAPPIEVTTATGDPHTLYVWGEAPPDAGARVRGLVTRDLPPGR